MNFCKVFFSKLTKTCDDHLFGDIIGYDHTKRVFGMALDADSVVHILLVGPPASAKTMFLTSLMHHLKRSYFADGTNSTKSGTWNISSLTRISQKVPSNVIFTLNLTSATNVANQPDVKLECLTSHLPSIAGTTAARIMKNYSSIPLPHEKLSMP